MTTATINHPGTAVDSKRDRGGKCFHCGIAAGRDDYCFGCGKYVCQECNSNLRLMGKHLPGDHLIARG